MHCVAVCGWSIALLEGAGMVTPVVPQPVRDWEECQLVQMRRSAASLGNLHILRTLKLSRCSVIAHEKQ